MQEATAESKRKLTWLLEERQMDYDKVGKELGNYEPVEVKRYIEGQKMGQQKVSRMETAIDDLYTKTISDSISKSQHQEQGTEHTKLSDGERCELEQLRRKVKTLAEEMHALRL